MEQLTRAPCRRTAARSCIALLITQHTCDAYCMRVSRPAVLSGFSSRLDLNLRGNLER